MQRALVALNEKWKEEGKPEIGVGIGINYGDTFAGNIGSHLRLEYTVIGDAVNVASRLCSKSGKGEILISDPLYQMLKDKPAGGTAGAAGGEEPGGAGAGVEGEDLVD